MVVKIDHVGHARTRRAYADRCAYLAKQAFTFITNPPSCVSADESRMMLKQAQILFSSAGVNSFKAMRGDDHDE